MSAGPAARLSLERATRWAGAALVLGVFATGLVGGGTFVAVQHTARSEFCNSCHIMEPYFESWQHSAHSQVACVECHYEPGALETLEGKFQALSQLSKYVTRTAGTKPWAEVSDLSCMRTGCHSVRTLDGPVDFGRVRFDHRQHLLESRPGRELRCVSCHAQIVQGEHFAVAESVCFACHFMPGPDGVPPPATSDCLVCHRPPAEPVDVAGRAFVHADYLARGVSCRECHDPVVQGGGAVRRERCESCHGEVEYVERIGETAFLHETHVTENKVECFECHEQISHGLLPLEPPRPAPGEGCGACHVDAHEAPRLLYAGAGARGVPEAPSRMYETRVVCRACHTGRTDEFPADHLAAGATASPHAGPAAAAAGEADCIHCHGPSYDGLLGEWQAAVGEQLQRLRPLIEGSAPSAAHGAADPVARMLGEARANFELVDRDGSRGAHNPLYAMDALRAAAARLDEAALQADPSAVAAASAGFPFRSSEGCSACHIAPEQLELEVHGRPFEHRAHLSGGSMECSACHLPPPGDPALPHGAPAFPREQCASCHHQESEERDVSDCASCHAVQAEFLAGRIAGLEGKPDAMAELDCGDCHGQPPAIVRPKPAMCALCHDPTYAEMPAQWYAAFAEMRGALERAAAEHPGPAAESARALIRALDADGSRGAHNFPLAKELLERQLGELQDG